MAEIKRLGPRVSKSEAVTRQSISAPDGGFKGQIEIRLSSRDLDREELDEIANGLMDEIAPL